MSSAAGGAAAGAAAVVAAALLWASIGVLSVGLFGQGVSPWEVAFWRAAIAALTLGGALLILSPRSLRLERRRDLGLLAGFGAVGVGLFYVAFQLAIVLTSVAVAVVLLYTAPVWVVVGAAILLGEPLGGRRLAMVAVVVLGVWATALGAAGAQVRIAGGGIAWGLVAALAYATYYLFGKRFLPRLGVARVLFYSLAAGALLLWPAAVIAGHPPRFAMPAASWALLVALALATTLLANALYYWGLGRIEAGQAAIVASVEPVIAALLAAIAFRQALTPLGWAGVAMVAGGVAAGATATTAARRGTRRSAPRAGG